MSERVVVFCDRCGWSCYCANEDTAEQALETHNWHRHAELAQP